MFNHACPPFFFFRKHNCPKPSRPKTELFPNTANGLDGNTEYKTIYLKHSNVTPRENFKPAQKVIQRDSPMSNDTTNRVDYVSRPVTPIKPRPPAAYKKPEGIVSGESEYLREYQYKPPDPRKPILPPSSTIRTANDEDKFFVKSTQAADFKPYEVQPRVIYGENRVYQPPSETFGGVSTFQSDFQGKKAEPVASLKPTQETKVSRDPFTVNSCYSSDYKRYQLPDKFKHEKQAYNPPSEKFQGISSFTSDFPGYRGVTPAQSFKPPMTAKTSHEPLDAMTTNRMSYLSWELPPRFSRPPTTFVPPNEKFSTSTIFQNDFVSHGVPEPIQNFKPKQEAIKNTTPFDHKTLNRTDYQPIDLSQRIPLVVKENKYAPPTEKFDGQSTTGASYQGRSSSPARTCKPQLKPYVKGVKFDQTSTYKQCYTSPSVNLSCNMSSTNNGPCIPGYTFSYEDPRSGHKFYVATPVPKPPTLPMAGTQAAITAH